METELQEIKREISEVESKLDNLMSVDTTELYFNVDSMKKLTEVGKRLTVDSCIIRGSTKFYAILLHFEPTY